MPINSNTKDGLVGAYYEYLQNKKINQDVKEAFYYLVASSLELKEYEFKLSPHGVIENSFNYLKDGLVPFAFILNQKWIKFYFRLPHRTHPNIALEELKQFFQNVKPYDDGQISFNFFSKKDAIKAMEIAFKSISEPEYESPDEVTPAEVLYEGSVKQIIVNQYERNQAARKECIQHYGYNCIVCGFSFKEKYGELGNEFIHIHHLIEISRIKREYEINPIKDLRPVCANCHSIIHRRKPAISIEDLSKIIKNGT